MSRAPDDRLSGPRLASGLGRLAQYPVWILAAVACITWLYVRHIQLSHDVIWQFWAARQMLGGARLYSEIWEVNPPLWFWSAMPVEWLAALTGIGWQTLQVSLLVLASALTSLLVLRLVDLGKPLYNLLLVLIVFWLSAVVPLADLGQREHLALMFSLPYAALIARRTSGKSVPAPLALVVSALAAFGFALKHYFVLVPIALELWLWLCSPRSWKPWRPELFVLAGLAVAYAASVVWFTPEFFTVALPMIDATYHAYDATLYDVLFHPWAIYWALAIVFLIAFHRKPKNSAGNDSGALFMAMIIMAACFSVAYFLQHKGPYYHALPVTGALTIAVFLCLVQFEKVRAIPIGLGIALIYLPLSTAIAIQDKSEQFVNLADGLFSRGPAGEPVFVASTNPLFWPAVENHKLVWPSRAGAMWTLPAIAEGELHGLATPELEKLARQLNSTLFEDLRCNPPAIILFPNNIPVGPDKTAFPMKDFLFRDPGLRQFIESNYALSEEPKSVHIYMRTRPVPRATNLNCRIVR